jgi:hypothetical protein
MSYRHEDAADADIWTESFTDPRAFPEDAKEAVDCERFA